MKIALYIANVIYKFGGTESYTANLMEALQQVCPASQLTVVTEHWPGTDSLDNRQLVERLNEAYGTRILADRVIETSISNSADYRKRIAFEDSVCDIQDYILQRFGRRNLDEFRFNESRAKKYVERALKFNQVADFIKYARKLRSNEFKYKMMRYFPLLWYIQHKIRIR